MLLSFSISTVKPVALGEEIKSIENNCDDLFNEVQSLVDLYYNPKEISLHNKELKNDFACLLNLTDSDNLYTLEYELNINEKNLPYWQFSINKIYCNLDEELKESILKINNENSDFNTAFNLISGNSVAFVNNSEPLDEIEECDYKKILNTDLDNEPAEMYNKNKFSLALVGTAFTVFNVMNSMVVGIESASWIPFVGWGIAVALLAALIIFIVANWSYIMDSFHGIIQQLKTDHQRISNILDQAENEGSKEAQNNPDVSNDATSQNQMQKQVERGQAPKDVDRVDKAHNSNGQDHVHFKDGTSLNKDGTIHDKGKGVPNPSNAVWDWLHGNGWCMNGIK